MTVDNEIKKLNSVYDAVHVDKYCIMPDHIHFILAINTNKDGRTQFAPTISRVIKQFNGSIAKQIGRPIWQKSFYDHGIRNQQDYDEIWEYIENNPLKYALEKDTSFYERYGWQFLCMVQGDGEPDMTRMYIHMNPSNGRLTAARCTLYHPINRP